MARPKPRKSNRGKKILVIKKKVKKIVRKFKKKVPKRLASRPMTARPKKKLKRPKTKTKKRSPVVRTTGLKKAAKRAVKKIRKISVAPKSKKTIIKKRKPLPSAPQTQTPFLQSSFFKAKIKVIGIGGGGGSIVSEIGRSLHKATFVVADTDVRAFKKRKGIKYFLFGQELTHGLGTGVNPELGRQAAESEKEKISQLFSGQDIVIFVASLGGGLSSGATKVFADAAKDFNGITLGIFTLPFKFEGKQKSKIAQKALKELRRVLNVSITIPNERIFKIIQANTAITDAFSIVNKSLIDSLENLIDLIYSPGIINIDFADLRAVLAGRGNLAFLNTAEASGKDRAQVVSQKILYNPLYQQSGFVAQKILFNIEGGKTLSMFEVDKISRAISEKNPAAKIIFGISKNPAYKQRIKTTLLMTGQGSVSEPEVAPLPAKPVQKKINPVKKAAAPKPVRKAIQKPAVVITKKKSAKKPKPAPVPKMPATPTPEPVFALEPFERQPAVAQLNSQMVDADDTEIGFKKLEVTEASAPKKKAIRRSALDIKKAQEEKEQKQTLQEKEWEIPAFLRLKK